MAIKYIPFNPTVLQGQAVLSNFTRTRKILSYRGDDEVEPHITRGMPLYETKEIETRGENKDDNLIIRGECVSACAYLKEKGITVDLVYIDPPFASGADYAKKVYLRRNPKLAEALAKAEAELDNEDMRTFEAKMYGDIWEKEKYLNWMYENLMAIKSVMSPTASIYVHLDYHIGHYVKILLDEVFGESNFQREIIWDIQVLSGFKTIAPNWVRGHDSIFYYSIGPKRIFNKLKQPHKKEYLDSFDRVDENGRHYMVAHGTKRYRDEVEAKGKPYGDVWNDIMSFQQQPTSDEKVDYATQKPTSLLERIILSSSNEGMVVADFFGGSGVTASVASKHKRKFVHADINENSITTTRDRLVKENAQFKWLEIQDGVRLFRNPIQTDNIIPSLITGLVSDRTLSSYWSGVINDSKLGKMPVYIPKLVSGSEARVVSVATVHKLIYEQLSQLDNVKKVIIYYIDLEDKPLIDEYIKIHNNTGIDIEFRDLKIVLDNLIAQDEAEFEVNQVQDGLMTKWEVDVVSFVSDRVKRKIDEFNEKSAFNNTNDSKTICLSDNGLEAIEWISVDCTSSDPNAPWTSSQEIRIETDSYISLNGKKTKSFWNGKISSDEKPLRIKIRNICGDESVYVLENE